MSLPNTSEFYYFSPTHLLMLKNWVPGVEIMKEVNILIQGSPGDLARDLPRGLKYNNVRVSSNADGDAEVQVKEAKLLLGEQYEELNKAYAQFLSGNVLALLLGMAQQKDLPYQETKVKNNYLNHSLELNTDRTPVSFTYTRKNLKFGSVMGGFQAVYHLIDGEFQLVRWAVSKKLAETLFPDEFKNVFSHPAFQLQQKGFQEVDAEIQALREKIKLYRQRANAILLKSDILCPTGSPVMDRNKQDSEEHKEEHEHPRKDSIVSPLPTKKEQGNRAHELSDSATVAQEYTDTLEKEFNNVLSLSADDVATRHAKITASRDRCAEVKEKLENTSFGKEHFGFKKAVAGVANVLIGLLSVATVGLFAAFRYAVAGRVFMSTKTDTAEIVEESEHTLAKFPGFFDKPAPVPAIKIKGEIPKDKEREVKIENQKKDDAPRPK